jgi:hypothetical protein
MAYRQYTHCIEKSDFDSFWNFAGRTQDPAIPLFVWGALRAALWAFVGALVGAGLGSAFGPGGSAVGAAVGGAFGLSEGFIDGFCDQWLNRRLICIERDKCALGKVAGRAYRVRQGQGLVRSSVRQRHVPQPAASAVSTRRVRLARHKGLSLADDGG